MKLQNAVVIYSVIVNLIYWKYLLCIKAQDVDQVGEILDVQCLPPDQDSANVCEFFKILPRQEDTKINMFRGNIVLMKPFNYRERQIYQIKLGVFDGVHNDTTDIIFSVVDVQNSPPIFEGKNKCDPPSSPPPPRLDFIFLFFNVFRFADRSGERRRLSRFCCHEGMYFLNLWFVWKACIAFYSLVLSLFCISLVIKKHVIYLNVHEIRLQQMMEIRVDRVELFMSSSKIHR